MEPHHLSSSFVLSSFTSAVGMALGELLLLTGKPEELFEQLRAIDIAARAALMSSNIWSPGEVRTPGVSLPVAALGVIRAWHEGEDSTALGDALALLEEVLRPREVVDPEVSCALSR